MMMVKMVEAVEVVVTKNFSVRNVGFGWLW